MRFAIIIEKGVKGYGAYAPDVPGCGAAGATPEEARENLRGALAAHLQLMADDGETLPEPASSVEYLEVSDVAAQPATKRGTRKKSA